ncbi:T9SS type A sorting domain-containing protein [candidate division KSB1 bacterium]|nr:T9SS type A sorting domain-containing protein [candidate division KSB1 bacterium]
MTGQNRLFIYSLRILLFYSVMNFSFVKGQALSDIAAYYTYITYLAVNQQQPDIIYTATLGAGLYKSEDAGETWHEINQSAGIRKYHVVAVDPQNPRRLLAGGLKSGVWLSEDDGQNWRHVGLDTVTICHLSIDPTQPQKVVVLAPEGIYLTENINSQPWRLVFDYLDHLKTIQVTEIKDYLFDRWQKISINPHNPNEIYAACTLSGYFLSQDGGQTWYRDLISNTSSTGQVDIIVFHPTNPKILYAATHHHGVYKSYNRGESWLSMSRGIEPQRRSPYDGAYVVSGLSINPFNPEILITGSSFGNWMTKNGGISWQEVDRSLTCEYIRSYTFDPVNPQKIYAGSNVGIYRSMDGGFTWEAKNKGFPLLELKMIQPISFNRHNYEYGLDKYNRFVFRRSILPLSEWMYISWGLYDYRIDSIIYDSDQQTLNAHSPSGIFSSTDGGYNWNVPIIEWADIQSELKTEPFAGNLKDPLYWTFDVELRGSFFFTDSFIYKTGNEMPHVILQLVSPQYPVDGSMPIWQTKLNDYVKATLQIPVLYIQNRQKLLLYAEVRHFQKNRLFGYEYVTPGSNTKVVIDMTPDKLLPALVSPDYVPPTSQPITSVMLDKNYPNPFNQSTTIRFELAKTAHVNLSIYNLKGQKVSTIIDGNILPGTYQGLWDGVSDEGKLVASGIYLVRLEAEEMSATIKMTLIR